MIKIKSSQDIDIMREGGVILAEARDKLATVADVGVVLKDLDGLAKEMITRAGAQPAFLGYRPAGAQKSYPSSICASVNSEVVHGIPGDYKLKSGDVLKIDLGVFHKGFYTDSAVTVGIGSVSSLAKKIIKVTKECLELAIEECYFGKTLGDIGWVINDHAVKNGFKPLRGLTGHGIGKDLHEEPVVLNEGRKGAGLTLSKGMVLAIEPMISSGGGQIKQLPQESYAAKDGSLTAHFEHTVAITGKGPFVLTIK